MDIKPQIELIGEEIKIAKQNVAIEPLVFCVNWDYSIKVGETHF
jgi:hypothetical protein